MKADQNVYRKIKIFIALIWLVNGLICKVLNLVPRHQQIVEEIIGSEHLQLFTLFIGIAETVMAVWILSNFQSRVNAIVQILVIGTMNVLEFTLVPHLLLWGKLNAFFALLLVALIYYNEFVLKQRIKE